MSMLITTVVGARPQFIKYALLCHELTRRGLRQRLVHTGQHYDDAMSEIFFRELELPAPDVNLGIGSDTPARQVGRMMMALEEEFNIHRPDLVLVFGDTNSTLAGALAAAGPGLPLAHVEAGMRSYNRSMPEERNRVLTDHLADLLFCHNQKTADLLRGENVQGKIIVAGDAMRETTAHFLPRALEQTKFPCCLGLHEKDYILLTVHRPINADDYGALEEIMHGMNELGLSVIFPIHPRTRTRNAALLSGKFGNIKIIDPVGYLDSLALTHRARLVVTDSGGLQKEALFLGTPCVTLRGETEWTETLEMGMNALTGDRPEATHLMKIAGKMLKKPEADKFSNKKTENHLDQFFGSTHVAANIASFIDDFLNSQAKSTSKL